MLNRRAGTTSGLGRQTALLLGSIGAHVIMGNRHPENAEVLVQEIRTRGGSAMSFRLDLASFASVREFAAQVIKHLDDNRHGQLDVLINNAGILQQAGPTRDGYQKVWQVNALAPALLTDLLLPKLSSTGRVLNVSSELHRVCGWSRHLVAQCPPPATGGASTLDYARSKACQIVHAHALTLAFAHETQRNDTLRRRALAIEPGLVRTQIARNVPAWFQSLEYAVLGPFFLRSIDQGCASILFGALAPSEELGSDPTDPTKDAYYFANCAGKRPAANAARVEEALAWSRLVESIVAQQTE